jgi:chorismate mutase/prephenate dehydratase
LGLDEWRTRIDDIDRQLLRLLNQRAALAIEIGRAKQSAGLPVYAPEREQGLLDGLLQLNPGPLPAEAVRAVWSEILSASRRLQRPFRVAHLGPAATYTHLAALRHFGASADYVPVRGIPDVFTEVECGRADVGVVPVENSTEGAVNLTLDELVDSALRISAEIQLEIHHQLLARAPDLGEVKQVVAHPQALAQCRGWLDRHLPHAQTVEVASNTIGAERAVDDPSVAAIASELASVTYGLPILRERIEDNPQNVTRFWVIGREAPMPTGRDKTSILFSVRDEVGALYRVIEPFATGRCNLSKIESRPTRRRPWEYVFFVDVSGHESDLATAAVLDAVRERCLFVKVLGSYPAAAGPAA